MTIRSPVNRVEKSPEPLANNLGGSSSLGPRWATDAGKARLPQSTPTQTFVHRPLLTSTVTITVSIVISCFSFILQMIKGIVMAGQQDESDGLRKYRKNPE